MGIPKIHHIIASTFRYYDKNCQVIKIVNENHDLAKYISFFVSVKLLLQPSSIFLMEHKLDLAKFSIEINQKVKLLAV